MTTATNTLKPREMWETEDHLDFLDGWHEASDVGFRTDRDAARAVVFTNPHAPPRQLDEKRRDYQTHAQWLAMHRLSHPADALQASGRAARQRHREATGL